MIRTCDLLLRRQSLYPAELREQKKILTQNYSKYNKRDTL